MARTRQTTKPATKPPAELPDWLKEEPSEIRYSLEATHVEECHESGQEIALTRDEFIALKHCLGHLRGFLIPEATNV